jgi:GxxExxY protein
MNTKANPSGRANPPIQKNADNPLIRNNPDPVNPLIPENPGSDFLHKALTHNIIGCAMEVHRILGNGFQEVMYQRALAIEMDKKNIVYQREAEAPVFYKEYSIGSRRVDFFVENKIMVEIKATIHLEDVHLAQALNYLEAFNMEIGLLINFGSRSLQFKRLLNKKYTPVQSR